jgi:hypothetical protein
VDIYIIYLRVDGCARVAPTQYPEELWVILSRVGSLKLIIWAVFDGLLENSRSALLGC